MRILALVWSLIFVAPLIALSVVAYGCVSLFLSLFDSDPRKQNRIERAWANAILRIAGVTVTVEGLEKLTPNESYVFASNHLSYLDTPVVLGRIPVLFRFLAKRGLFKIPFMGWHLHRAGHVSVPLDDPRGALRTLTQAAGLLRKERISILIFPEGGRSPDGVLQEFKDGAAYLAIKGQVPVVPLALLGPRERLPFGSITFRRGAVRLRIGQPIATENLKLGDRTALTDAIRQQIVAMLRPDPEQ